MMNGISAQSFFDIFVLKKNDMNQKIKRPFAVMLFVMLSIIVNAQTVTKFIDSANMDFTVKPGDDFYTYASGAWIKNNPVPAKETRWGSFNMLRDFNITAVKKVLETAAADKTMPEGSADKRVGDFYTAGMDSALIEARGFKPVVPYIKNIAKVSDKQTLLSKANEQRTMSVGGGFFSFFIGQDRKNVEHLIPQLGQGGITLPDRDFYLKNDAKNTSIQDAYKKYITTIFTLAGNTVEQAQQNANTIYELEKKLAAAQKSRVEMRDAYKTYNKFLVADFSKTTPSFNWSKILTELKVTGEDSIIVNNPSFFLSLDSIFNAAPLDDLKAYLQWNVLKGAAPHLSSAFVDANFTFNKVLSGQKVQTPRWQRISQLTDGSIGELLGQLYVKEYFKPEAKARMNELIANVRKAFATRINKLDWMSAETKQKALAKLAAFRPKIGYPDKWKNYEGLDIKPNRHFENVMNAGKWAYDFQISQLGKPVDRTRFGMTPPTVNAYYSSTLNEIVFPAGILQFPFFDPNADDAVNYGGIGAVIGHEMSHGFDDNGSKYDADGTLRNWWTQEDSLKFVAKTVALGKQFDAYTVLDTLHVNGKLTMGENIGDLGGLNVAYEAFKMTKQGQADVKIDGFTPDQRFFLSWAQVWRGNILPETAAQLLITDTHSPGPYRTIGAPVNMDAWYQAFDVKPGDKLYKKPEERIKIW
jgi:putative endopeptidase